MFFINKSTFSFEVEFIIDYIIHILKHQIHAFLYDYLYYNNLHDDVVVYFRYLPKKIKTQILNT